MRLFDVLLAAVVSLATPGIVAAKAVDDAPELTALSRITEQRSGGFGVSSVSMPPSLIDALGITAGAEYRTSSSGAVGHYPKTTTCDLDRVAKLPLGFRSGDIPGLGKEVHGSFLFANTLLAAVPEPADWMMPLCALVVIAVIARRKASWLAH